MHTAHARSARQINRGAALKGRHRLNAAGEGKMEKIAAGFLASGVPRNATHFISKQSGSNARTNSAVICQFGESAAKLMGMLFWLQLREQNQVADA